MDRTCHFNFYLLKNHLNIADKKSNILFICYLTATFSNLLTCYPRADKNLFKVKKITSEQRSSESYSDVIVWVYI